MHAVESELKPKSNKQTHGTEFAFIFISVLSLTAMVTHVV